MKIKSRSHSYSFIIKQKLLKLTATTDF